MSAPHSRRALAAWCLLGLAGALAPVSLAAPLSLDDIAEYLCVSRRTLTRLVATHTGSTVMARLQTFRLLRAAELLWQTDHALATVAEKAGIPHLSYFCRCFRRHFGVTPMQYRRQAH